MCDDRAEVLSALDGNFSEKPVSLGLSLDGRVVEVLKSPGGTWTIIMTAPTGGSCLLLAVQYWQNVAVPLTFSGDHTGDATKPLYRDGKRVPQLSTALTRDNSDPQQVLERADVQALRDATFERAL